MADAYLTLIEAERAGTFKMPLCELERVVGEIRPDLSINLALPDGRQPGFFLEVDRGFESLAVIERKCQAYVRAWMASDTAFPYVVFVVQEQWRQAELERCLLRLDEEDRRLFSVVHMEKLASSLVQHS